MKVSELIEKLKKIDGNRIVIIQKDAEGNGYSPLSNLWEGSYKAETTWWGEVGLEKLTKKDIKQGYGKEDVLDGESALILEPVN